MAEPETDDRRPAYIEDDTVVEATWPGTDSLRPITFTYKPLNAEQAAAYHRKLLRAGDDIAAIQRIVCKMLAAQLVSWDLKRPDGSAVDCKNWVEVARLDDIAVLGIREIIEKSAQTLEEARKNS